MSAVAQKAEDVKDAVVAKIDAVKPAKAKPYPFWLGGESQQQRGCHWRRRVHERRCQWDTCHKLNTTRTSVLAVAARMI